MDYDDVAIYNTTPPNEDANGNPFIGPIDWNGTIGTTCKYHRRKSCAPPADTPDESPAPPVSDLPATILFEETFDNASLNSTGWYDNTSPVFSTTETIPGSYGALRYSFYTGATRPVKGGASQRKFTPSDSVYMRYYVKYSSNWVGSGRKSIPMSIIL